MVFFVILMAVPADAKQAAEPSKQMEQFLDLKPSVQSGYINNGIVMIGVVAAQTQPKIAKCIDVWYSTSEEKTQSRKAEIIKTMKKYPQYAPAAIILAVVEKACGKFKRSK